MRNISLLLAGICSLTIGVGVARFAFTSLLPDMLGDFLTVSQAGFLAALNYVGYLAGAILAIFLQNSRQKWRLFQAGIILSILTTLILAFSHNFWWWAISRIIAGFAAAMILVVGSSIIMSQLKFSDTTRAMGIHFSGIGFAILLPDLFTKLTRQLAFSWEETWLILAVLGMVLAIYPLWRIGEPPPTNGRKIHFNRRIFTPFVLLLMAAYFTEGVGFVVQATFLPDIINHILPGYGTLTWLFVGFSGIVSCVVLMNLAHRFGSINIIIFALLLQCLGILIPTLSNWAVLNIFSGILYGGTFIGLVALFMHLGGIMSNGNPTILMGILTTAYGIGQVSAPLYTAQMLTAFGSYNPALYLTAGIVFSGAVLMWISRRFYRNPAL